MYEKVWMVSILQEVNEFGEMAMMFVDVYTEKQKALEMIECLESNGNMAFIQKLTRCKE